jgi:hypothetical protein
MLVEYSDGSTGTIPENVTGLNLDSFYGIGNDGGVGTFTNLQGSGSSYTFDMTITSGNSYSVKVKNPSNFYNSDSVLYDTSVFTNREAKLVHV